MTILHGATVIRLADLTRFSASAEVEAGAVATTVTASRATSLLAGGLTARCHRPNLVLMKVIAAYKSREDHQVAGLNLGVTMKARRMSILRTMVGGYPSDARPTKRHASTRWVTAMMTGAFGVLLWSCDPISTATPIDGSDTHWKIRGGDSISMNERAVTVCRGKYYIVSQSTSQSEVAVYTPTSSPQPGQLNYVNPATGQHYAYLGMKQLNLNEVEIRCGYPPPVACQESQDCVDHGRCSGQPGKCEAIYEYECKESTFCKQRGHCRVIGKRCGAHSEEDCRNSKERNQLRFDASRHQCVNPYKDRMVPDRPAAKETP